MAVEKKPRRAGRKLKVLIIEDEADVCEVVEMRLRRAGQFEVATELGGARGLKAAVRLRPDLVLLDLAMPDLDGWDVCRALRSNPATAALPIVVMTARWETGAAAMAQALRVKRVLFKPLDFDELVETMRRAVPAAPRNGSPRSR